MKKLPWLLPVLLLANGCSSTPETNDLTVVATTSILGDVTRQLIGDIATVEVLIPADAEPHSFQASARQAASLRDADLVIANGLGLEAALSDVLSAAEADGVFVVEIGPNIQLRTPTGSVNLDPHYWLDPQLMARAANVIAVAVTDLAETRREELLANLAVFQSDLTALDQEVEKLLADVSNRKLVTNHNSLGYLSARYGFEVVGTVVPGGSTLASPSPRAISDLIQLMEEEGIGAVFTDAKEAGSLAELVADESESSVTVVELFIGALGPAGSGADTYQGMLRVNAGRIAGALA